MMESEETDIQKQPGFYENGAKYWEGIEPTIDGMLGGLAEVSEADVAASIRFLNTFLQKKDSPTGSTYALDCGAGIGRVTKYVLSTLFDKVDLLEQNENFLNKSIDYIGENGKKVGRKFCSGIQGFTPEIGKYDVIWLQWVTGHLTDDDFVEFLRKAVVGLRPNGMICVKENIACGSEQTDREDSSVTRPKSALNKIFRKAKLKVVLEKKQIGFPTGLFEVKMFALKPVISRTSNQMDDTM